MRIYAKRKQIKYSDKPARAWVNKLDDVDISDTVVDRTDIWPTVGHIKPVNALFTDRKTTLSEPAMLKAWFRDTYYANGCFICGEADVVCLVMHHLYRSTKVAAVGDMIRSRMPLDMIEAEAAKCIAICRNCHARIHLA